MSFGCPVLFDYPSQAAIVVPTDLPPPNGPNHTVEVVRLAGESARRLGGRTMVLTTSLRALRAIGANLIEPCEGTDLEIWFRVPSPSGSCWCVSAWLLARERGGCLLVGSVSFGE